MRVPDESEELEIDRLLQQLGIRLPPVDLSDDTQSAHSYDKDDVLVVDDAKNTVSEYNETNNTGVNTSALRW